MTFADRKEPQVELLPGIPSDLDAVSLTSTGAWVGVGGRAAARELHFGGHRVRTSIACRSPLICALDSETAALVDGRTTQRRPNAWVVRADGERVGEFHAGDAVQSLAAIGGRLVVTHFDEGYGNPLHGALAFDPTGELLLDYERDVPGALTIVDCYAVASVGRDSVLLLIYPDFPLAEVTQGIHGALQAAERLRVVRLRNADEPVTAFAARPPKAPAAAAPARRRRR